MTDAEAPRVDGADLHHLETTPADALNQAMVNADHRGHRLPCRVRPPERWLWTSEDRDERAAAAQRCEPCPVRVECLAFAVANLETFGVWSGVDFGDRRNQRRRAERPLPAGFVPLAVKRAEWAVTQHRMGVWLAAGLIPGAYKGERGAWLVPADAARPEEA